MTNEKWLKQKYQDARSEAFASGKLDKIRQNNGVYTTEMILALRDMAENKVYPDWNFSDDEYNVWSLFRK